jgi:hypothetical protein
MSSQTPVMIAAPTSRSSIIPIIGGLVLLAIIGTLSYYFIFKKIKPSPDQTKTYNCDGKNCVPDPSGEGVYDDPNCKGECNPPRYSCNDFGVCNPDSDGIFTDPNCNGKCKSKIKRYDCVSGKCTPSEKGIYISDDCGGKCSK